MLRCAASLSLFLFALLPVELILIICAFKVNCWERSFTLGRNVAPVVVRLAPFIISVFTPRLVCIPVFAGGAVVITVTLLIKEIGGEVIVSKAITRINFNDYLLFLILAFFPIELTLVLCAIKVDSWKGSLTLG